MRKEHHKMLLKAAKAERARDMKAWNDHFTKCPRWAKGEMCQECSDLNARALSAIDKVTRIQSAR